MLNQPDTGMLDSLLLQKGPMDPVAAEVTQIQRKLREPRQVAPLMWLELFLPGMWALNWAVTFKRQASHQMALKSQRSQHISHILVASVCTREPREDTH